MNLIQAIIPISKTVRPGNVYAKKYIIIHETDNTDKGSNARAHANLLKSEAKSDDGYYVSYHYCADDKNIFQMIPFNEKTFNCANTEGNKYGIAIEICVNSDGNFEKALQNAAELVADLYYQCKLWRGNMRQHYDFNGKNCPKTLRNTGRWNEFLNMCDKAYDKKYGAGSKKPTPPKENNDEEARELKELEDLKVKYTALEKRVAKIENKMIYNYIDGNMPDWARPTIQKMVDKGYLRGNEKNELMLTDEMIRIFVTLDRAGAYGN